MVVLTVCRSVSWITEDEKVMTNEPISLKLRL